MAILQAEFEQMQVLRTRRPEAAAELDVLAALIDSDDLEALRAGSRRWSSWLARQLGAEFEP